MKTKQKWTSPGTRRIFDAYRYRELTLAMIWPRSAPEYLTDDEISIELNECWQAKRKNLPWKRN